MKLPAAERRDVSAGETIALCMIVKDEAAVIGRCVDSVRDVVDSWVIVDTGSTDGTPEVVRALLGDLPGELHTAVWRDFGTNRSELLELARGAADYLLLLDADMTLRRVGPMPQLTCDAYLLQHEGELAYAVPRLVRSDLPWHYVGSTHEYLACERGFDRALLPALRVVHHGDGGSRADKLTRDLYLLTRQLEAMPNDPRTVFYLAQTWRDLGDSQRAAALYAWRAKLGGFEEETFYAAFQHALLTSEVDWSLGRELLADAWEQRPQRVEPLYEIATRARGRGELAISDWATKVGIGANMPDDILFVHRFVYDWGMRLERSIACARRGDLAEARAITEELLAEKSLPEHVTAALVPNRAWLEGRTPPTLRRRPAHGVPRLAQLCRDVDVVVLAPTQARPGQALTSPSIASCRGSLSYIVRCVDLDGGEDSTARVVGADRSAPTNNVLVALDEGLTPIAETALHGLDDPSRRATGVFGVEDWRLFSWRDRWWALATSRAEGPNEHCDQVLISIEDGRCEMVATLEGPGPSGHGENWAPFLLGGELCVVYRVRPFRVLRFDEQGSRLEPLVTVPTDCRFAGLQGVAPGLPVDDGYLFIAHQVVQRGHGQQHVHRFFTLDGSLTPSGISDPFTFVGEAVERCAGMAIRGDELVLSFGAEARGARLAVVPLEAVISLIEPLG
jgi:hypothetical protein